MRTKKDWELVGAGSGFLAAFALTLYLVVVVATDPSGSPALPAVDEADAAPAFVAAHLNAWRMEMLLLTAGALLLLWFLPCLWTSLRRAEGAPGRAALATLAAGVGGGTLMLISSILGYTLALASSPTQAGVAPTLYTAGALSVATAGGVFALMLFAFARVAMRAATLPTWLGVYSMVAGLLCLFGLAAPFYDGGPLNAATGLLGRWIWFISLTIWLLLLGIHFIRDQRHAPSESTDDVDTQTREEEVA